MPSADLEREAHDFANRMSALLNGTVTHGPRVTSVLADDGSCHVGYRITPRDHLRLDPIPLSISAAPPRCFLVTKHQLRLDPEGIHLADMRAYVGVYADPDLQRPVVRYDYNRHVSRYPVAHVHVYGEAEPLAEIARRNNVPGDLWRKHFPVGGKRFRPCLEDLIEFLILENLVDAHQGWQAVINEHRERFYEIQLMAAVRRQQDVAADALRAEGWTCTGP